MIKYQRAPISLENCYIKKKEMYKHSAREINNVEDKNK